MASMLRNVMRRLSEDTDTMSAADVVAWLTAVAPGAKVERLSDAASSQAVDVEARPVAPNRYLVTVTLDDVPAARVEVDKATADGILDTITSLSLRSN